MHKIGTLGQTMPNNGILTKTYRYKISFQETGPLRKKPLLTACFQTSLSTFTLDLHTWGFILFNPQQLFYLSGKLEVSYPVKLSYKYDLK